MAADLINSVLDKLIDVFKLELSASVDPADPLRLNYIDKYPFQEDPTEVAVYLWVQFDKEKGRVPATEFGPDVGGGCRWKNHFRVEGRIRQDAAKENAYAQTAELNRRVVRALRRHWDLSNVVAEDGERVCFCDPQLIDKNVFKAFGGEVEWFGEVVLEFHLYSEEDESVWDGV